VFKDLAKQVILFIFFSLLLLCTPNFELKICLQNLSIFILAGGLHGRGGVTIWSMKLKLLDKSSTYVNFDN
jgi:hypothetical protein